MPLEAQCERLRSLVSDCVSKHLYSTAAFFADKLVSLSGGSPQDVFLLAQTYYYSKQFRRALHLLKRDSLLDVDFGFRYLAAKCLSEVQEWEEALSLLGDGEADEGQLLDKEEDDVPVGTSVSLFSAVCLLRGRIYEALENRTRAIQWYRASLQGDAFCYEAFAALVDNHMLTNAEELALVQECRLGVNGDRWLELLYTSKCMKYEQQDVIEQNLAELEAPLLAASISGMDTSPMNLTVSVPTGSRQQRQQQQQGNVVANGAKGCNTRSRDGNRLRTPPRGGTGSGSSARSQPDTDAMDTVVHRGSSVVTDTSEMVADQHAAPSTSGNCLEGAAPGRGCGLLGNVDVLTCRADWHFHRGAYAACYALTVGLLERDPYALQCLPLHLASAVQLDKKSELFMRGHKLVEEYPAAAISWFAVGCYYMCTKQYENARRYFAKATQLDTNCAPAWIGFGHAFAAQDERDQAMAAYRTAARLFPGMHLPVLGMGQEYCAMANLPLAERMLLRAQEMCPADSAVCHELGVLMYRGGQYAAAAMWLNRALELLPARHVTAAWEPTLVALGHTLRKQGQRPEALLAYRRALALAPGQPGTYTALGYTHHLCGQLGPAIEAYHSALALRPDDTFATEMLSAALQDFAVAELPAAGAGSGVVGGRGGLKGVQPLGFAAF